MHVAWQVVEPAVSAIQAFTPMQLLAAAICTILLGYIGILARAARRA